MLFQRSSSPPLLLRRGAVPVLLAAAALMAASCGGDSRAADEDRPLAAGQAPENEAPPENLDEDLVGEVGPAAWRTLPGFMGRQWVDDPAGEGIVLLGDSVSTAESGPWRATGLVRNEGPEDLAGAQLTAVLRDASGEELERAAASVPVTPIRAGEPAPFEIRATVDAGDVADVSWEAQPVDEPPAVRGLELETFWDRGFTDPRPVDSYAYSDPEGDGPHAHVVLGSLTNTGPHVDEVRVVGAWVERESGRVLWVAEGRVLQPEPVEDLDAAGPLTDDSDFDDDATDVVPMPEEQLAEPETTQPLVPLTVMEWLEAALGSGEAADVLFVVKAGTAPEAIDGAELYLWGMGR